MFKGSEKDRDLPPPQEPYEVIPVPLPAKKKTSTYVIFGVIILIAAAYMLSR